MATSLLRNRETQSRETQSMSPARMKNLTTTTEQGPLKQRHKQQEKQGPKQNYACMATSSVAPCHLKCNRPFDRI